MTDKGTDYSAKEIAELNRWLKLAEQIDQGEGNEGIDTATGFDVTADVEFGGEFNPRRHRTFRADNLPMSEVRKAMQAGPQAGADGSPARLSTYTAKSWEAQLHALQRTKAGREALAGELTVSARSQQRWGSGQARPSRASREAIGRAYEARATDPAQVARSAARAGRRVADAMNRAVADRYGADVRFFNISDLKFTRKPRL